MVDGYEGRTELREELEFQHWKLGWRHFDVGVNIMDTVATKKTSQSNQPKGRETLFFLDPGKPP